MFVLSGDGSAGDNFRNASAFAAEITASICFVYFYIFV